MVEDFTYEEQEIITRDEYIGDGIVVTKEYIYLGEGIYAEYRPEIIGTTAGEGSNPDNTVQLGEQENNPSRSN